MNRDEVMNQFVLDLSKPGQILTEEQALNLRKYGLSIEDDMVFLEVFDTENYDGWMPSVAGMEAIQKRNEWLITERQASISRQEAAERADIPDPGWVHNLIEKTFDDVEKQPERVKKNPIDELRFKVEKSRETGKCHFCGEENPPDIMEHHLKTEMLAQLALLHIKDLRGSMLPVKPKHTKGNLGDFMPEHLKGLPEYEGTEDQGLPF